MKYLLFTAAILILGSCCLFEKKSQIIPISNIDSSYTETVYNTQIDTVLMPPDASIYQAYIECIKNKAVLRNERTYNGKHTTISVSLKDNVLKVKAIDSGAIAVQYNKQHDITTHIKTIIQTLPPITTNILTWWQKALMAIGAITVVGGSVFTIVKLTKF